ncbi:MAG: hypothetical protein HQL81_16135 [Magnetococcales bacterium]|nr:hypothetical protein [Magnetococcales bacterium]
MIEKSSDSRTNWTKVDAHVIQPEEYEELPEWTEEMIMAADVYEHGELVRSGRPANDEKKITITERFNTSCITVVQV